MGSLANIESSGSCLMLVSLGRDASCPIASHSSQSEWAVSV